MGKRLSSGLLGGSIGVTLLAAIVVSWIVRAAAQSGEPEATKQAALNRELVTAIRARDVQAVRRLLDRGADANAKDLAARPDRHGTVQPPPLNEKPTALLIVFDDAPIPPGRDRGGAKHRDRQEPDEIVRTLLDRGADPNVADYDQTFPLFDAVKSKYIRTVRLLLRHGANPNQTWVHGITPLHRAVSNRDIPTVKALLAAGANRDARCAFDDPAHPLSEEVANLLKGAGGVQKDRLR